MRSGDHGAQVATLRDYLHVVRRRKWIVLQALVLVPAAAVLFSLHQQTLYRATAQVLLSSQNLAAQLTGTQSTGINLQPDRIAQTQADVARVHLLAQRVVGSVHGTHLTPQAFLDSSSVSSTTNADLLDFSVTNHDPVFARRLVNAYAAAYTAYRRQLDTASIAKALSGVNRRIAALARAHEKRTSLYASLVDRQQTLQTMEALQTSNASVVQQAGRVVQTQPKTTRNAILGVVLGLVLGIGLAFLWEALDTRVRSAEEISERLGGLPLLARLSAPPKRLSAKRRLVMLEEPEGTRAESFRMLRTNLDFVTLDRDVRTIMVTSAVEREGKSTTAANLAVALARAGRRVALVDLDLRRPIIAEFFDLAGAGVTQVALGHVKLDRALSQIALTDSRRGGRLHAAYSYGNGNGSNGSDRVTGLLEVLPSGPVPPDPGEFVATRALGEILAELRERADVVLIDAPPVLHVGDATALSARVDGIVVLTRMNVVRRNMLHELARQLATVPTPVLGFVVSDAAGESGYGYGYGYQPHPHQAREAEAVAGR